MATSRLDPLLVGNHHDDAEHHTQKHGSGRKLLIRKVRLRHGDGDAGVPRRRRHREHATPFGLGAPEQVARGEAEADEDHERKERSVADQGQDGAVSADENENQADEEHHRGNARGGLGDSLRDGFREPTHEHAGGEGSEDADQHLLRDERRRHRKLEPERTRKQVHCERDDRNGQNRRRDQEANGVVGRAAHFHGIAGHHGRQRRKRKRDERDPNGGVQIERSIHCQRNHRHDHEHREKHAGERRGALEHAGGMARLGA